MTDRRIFLSYSRADSSFVLKLAQDLRNRGAAIWLDQLDLKGGARWDKAIQSALQEAPGLIVVLSPDSVKSENVLDEVSFALEEGRTVVPVLLAPCEIPFRLRRLHYVDFTKSYPPALQQLLDTIGVQANSNARRDSRSDDSSQYQGDGPPDRGSAPNHTERTEHDETSYTQEASSRNRFDATNPQPSAQSPEPVFQSRSELHATNQNLWIGTALAALLVLGLGFLGLNFLSGSGSESTRPDPLMTDALSQQNPGPAVNSTSIPESSLSATKRGSTSSPDASPSRPPTATLRGSALPPIDPAVELGGGVGQDAKLSSLIATTRELASRSELSSTDTKRLAAAYFAACPSDGPILIKDGPCPMAYDAVSSLFSELCGKRFRAGPGQDEPYRTICVQTNLNILYNEVESERPGGPRYIRAG